jgi:uncharacterized membrane protein YebE (DUF533 family)
MFDAKSILEALMKGAAPQQAPPQQSGGGGFGDILGQLTKMAQGGASGGGAPASGGQSGGMGGLEEMLRKLAPQSGTPQNPHSASVAPESGGLGGLGGLGDILGKLQQQAAGAAGSAGLGGGSLMDILGKVMAQATDGVKEGAGRVGAATGATDALGKAMGGQSGEDMMAKLRELIAQNQLGAGAAAGGLGAVVLGTHAGRSVAMSAAKIGALALIGGLAYKAVLNYQNGRPLISDAHSVTEAAPQGSGFEPAAVSNESATLYIKAMIAAAAADGRIDQGEMDKIMGGLKQGGLDANAEEFLAGELNNPATTDDLANACENGEQAVQVYTAARIAISPDSGAEMAFLADLASKLGVDAKLAAHIDAAARNAA